MGRVVELLELVRGEAPPGDPSTWESMAVLIAPHWRGATWWTQLVGMRASSLTLGTLPDTHLSRWRARNGHEARWSASLVPTRTLSGQRQQEAREWSRVAEMGVGDRGPRGGQEGYD